MRGFVGVVLLCAFVVAQLAAVTTPAAAAQIDLAVSAGPNEAGKQPVVLTEPGDTCCFYTFMNRVKRAGSCKTDCTYLPVQLEFRFDKALAVYAAGETHPQTLPGNHRLLRPPIL